jgi:hypothetical protein
MRVKRKEHVMPRSKQRKILGELERAVEDFGWEPDRRLAKLYALNEFNAGKAYAYSHKRVTSIVIFVCERDWAIFRIQPLPEGCIASGFSVDSLISKLTPPIAIITHRQIDEAIATEDQVIAQAVKARRER